jgi:hypothetical protein
MGQSYILDPARYAGTPQQIVALANNELEVANLAFATLPIAIHNTGFSNLQVIADVVRGLRSRLRALASVPVLTVTYPAQQDPAPLSPERSA